MMLKLELINKTTCVWHIPRRGTEVCVEPIKVVLVLEGRQNEVGIDGANPRVQAASSYVEC